MTEMVGGSKVQVHYCELAVFLDVQVQILLSCAQWCTWHLAAYLIHVRFLFYFIKFIAVTWVRKIT